MTSGAPALALRPRRRRSRARAGDPEAFAALYAQHEQELFRYCRSILRSEEDARDALQNTMVRAFAALQTERRDLALRPWLFRIAHNEAISLIRRRPATAQLDESLGGADDTVERTVETRERLSLLRADLQDLPERQRGALVMRELSGLSHEQIGEALGTSARAVKQTLYEARSSLSDCAEGRAMACDAVQRALSDGDGRVSRSRRMRAHLRTCRDCERFRVGLERRPADLAALSPVLPLLGAPGVLAALKGGSVLGGAAGGTAAAVSAGTGGGFAGSILAAGTAKVAVVAATITVAGGAAVVIGTHGGQQTSRGAGASGGPVATGASTGTGASASTVAGAAQGTGTTPASAVPAGSTPVLKPGTSTAAGGVSTTASRNTAGGGGSVATGGTATGATAATPVAADAAQTERAAAKDAAKADGAGTKAAAAKRAQAKAAKKRAAEAKQNATTATTAEKAEADESAKAAKAAREAKAAEDAEAAKADTQDGAGG